ncbi:MAG: hypothetical protein HYZ23_02585 [Chloroflexi bacterium]|nr:hypothetical protein [Chloroflexota bacterium]
MLHGKSCFETGMAIAKTEKAQREDREISEKREVFDQGRENSQLSRFHLHCAQAQVSRLVFALFHSCKPALQKPYGNWASF